jgi:predicted glycogen debranching enzyme
MLPYRLPDRGAAPEYNAVDAALWYVVAVYEYLQAAASTAGGERKVLLDAVKRILEGHAAGTRYRIGVDSDGLLSAGESGVQLTWMDAKIGDWVVTPRIGKPVEIQALWLNALWIARQLRVPSARRWRDLLARGLASFAGRFWDPARLRLYDVVDVDHQRGTTDRSFRPNQILAVGGLPLPILEGAQARAVVDAVEAQLLTPLGLRSLAPSERDYRPKYGGNMRDRDSAYHQGTVWPWLIGPFVDAWIRVRGGTAGVRDEARQRFMAPLEAQLREGGLGHVSEVASAEAPHDIGGCPFQAWSLGELLRLERISLRLASPEVDRPALAMAP